MIALKSVWERLFLKLSGMSVTLEGIRSAISFLAIENSLPVSSANITIAPSSLRYNPAKTFQSFSLTV